MTMGGREVFELIGFVLGIFLWNVLGLLVSVSVARKKNRSTGAWGTVGFIFGWVSVLILALLPRLQPQQPIGYPPSHAVPPAPGPYNPPPPQPGPQPIPSNQNVSGARFCSNCGEAVNPGAKFCASCGGRNQ